jgi:Rps23 Pro-64 3,4-dihydroxylase Tpa1-like proline 4-hydroxylase
MINYNGKELAEGIITFDNVFIESENYLKKILDQNINWEKEKKEWKNNSSTVKDFYGRDVDIIRLPKHENNSEGILSELSLDFYNNIKPYLDIYTEKYKLETRFHEDAQLLRYSEGQKVDEHSDKIRFFLRNISLTYYINDEYEGGEIEFVNFDLKVKSKKNQLIIFPSTDVYTHKVHPVTGGLRYVIVQFIR